jgi:hypothetical protein
MDPQGVYIAYPDGYWWSGNHQGPAWNLGNGGAEGNFPNPDAGALTIGTASYTAPGDAIYISTTGNDTSGNGSVGSPYASLTKAITMAVTGNTIVLRAGVYNDGGDTQGSSATDGVRIDNKALTIQNYPNEAVWFDGSRVASSWTQSGATWSTSYDRVYDRSPTNTRGADDDTEPNWQWVNPSYPYAPWPDMVFVDGVPLEQVGSLGAVGPGKFFVAGADTGSGKWFAATALHIGDDPAGHEVRVSDKVMFMTFANPDCTIRGVGVRRYANANPDPGVIACKRDSCLVENVLVEDVAHDAISITGTPTGTSAANCALRKVSILRAGALGTTCYMGDNFELDRVSMQYTNVSRYNYSPQAGAFKTTKSQVSTVKDSVFDNIYGKAYWCDQTIDTAKCVNTLFTNIDDIAIKLECGSKALVANCLFVDVRGNGVQANNTDLVRIWNCTLTRCGTAGITRPISWDQDGRQANNPTYSYNRDQRQPQSYYDQPENQWTINNVTMYNTIITKPNAGIQGMFAIDDHTGVDARPLSAYNPVTDRNVFQWDTKPQYPWIFPPASPGGNATTYQTLTAVQSSTGLEAGSTLLTSGSVIAADYAVISPSYHNTAEPLPSDVAAAIGRSTGTKKMGAFV